MRCGPAGIRRALLSWPQQELGEVWDVQIRCQGSCSLLLAPTYPPGGPSDGTWGRSLSGPHAWSSSARVFCLSCRPQLPEPASARSCKSEQRPQREQGVTALSFRVPSTGAPASSVWPPAQAQDRLRAAPGEEASGGPGQEGRPRHRGSPATAAALLTTDPPAPSTAGLPHPLSLGPSCHSHGALWAWDPCSDGAEYFSQG